MTSDGEGRFVFPQVPPTTQPRFGDGEKQVHRIRRNHLSAPAAQLAVVGAVSVLNQQSDWLSHAKPQRRKEGKRRR
jgi:hypothetical protein